MFIKNTPDCERTSEQSSVIASASEAIQKKSMAECALRYFNTIKYIKPRQAWYRLRRMMLPLRAVSFPENIIPQSRTWLKPWHQTINYSSPVISESPLAFQFLNIPNASTDKLWLYNLHYHAVLMSNIAPALKKKIMRQWITENPVGQGIGWEPYPLSLRIVNWIKLGDAEFNHSLYTQCLSLEQQIEFHLLGNHLFENAKALVFAGVYFNTADSQRWFKRGMVILQAEISEQILADGGHFERSPMYHGIILEGMLDLYQLCTVSNDAALSSLQQQLRQRIPKMLQWLQTLSHPDHEIAFFNDATLGIAPTPQALFDYAAELGLPTEHQSQSVTHLQNSGFVRIENADAVILTDVGSLGPSYIPGHAHAGTLSFEMSLCGERLFVNRGISTYNANSERALERSTLAHNTIAVAGKNSSEVWSSFRVAKRAKVFGIEQEISDTEISFSAAHDGYHRLPQKITHKRKWISTENKIIIEDQLTGKGATSFAANYHLHPNWIVESHDGDIIHLRSTLSDCKVTIRFCLRHCERSVAMTAEDAHASQAMTEKYNYAIGFNNKISAVCISVINQQQSLPCTLRMELEW